MTNPSVTDQVAEVVRWLEATQDLLQSAGFVTCAEHEAMAARLIATLAAEVEGRRKVESFYLDETGCPVPSCSKAYADACETLTAATAATDALLAEVKRG